MSFLGKKGMDSTPLSPWSGVVPPSQVKLSSKGWNDLLGGSQLLAGRAVRAGEEVHFRGEGPQNLKDVKKRQMEIQVETGSELLLSS